MKAIAFAVVSCMLCATFAPASTILASTHRHSQPSAAAILQAARHVEAKLGIAHGSGGSTMIERAGNGHGRVVYSNTGLFSGDASLRNTIYGSFTESLAVKTGGKTSAGTFRYIVVGKGGAELTEKNPRWHCVTQQSIAAIPIWTPFNFEMATSHGTKMWVGGSMVFQGSSVWKVYESQAATKKTQTATNILVLVDKHSSVVRHVVIYQSGLSHGKSVNMYFYLQLSRYGEHVKVHMPHC